MKAFFSLTPIHWQFFTTFCLQVSPIFDSSPKKVHESWCVLAKDRSQLNYQLDTNLFTQTPLKKRKFWQLNEWFHWIIFTRNYQSCLVVSMYDLNYFCLCMWISNPEKSLRTSHHRNLVHTTYYYYSTSCCLIYLPFQKLETHKRTAQRL